MTTHSSKPSAPPPRVDQKPDPESIAWESLILQPTDDGWALMAPGGEVIFRGLGVVGRRQCLKFARDQGVLFVQS